MSSNKPMRRGMARVEFIASLDAIKDLLKQGYSKQMAYEKLKESGVISMTYVTFCKIVTRYRTQLPADMLNERQ